MIGGHISRLSVAVLFLLSPGFLLYCYLNVTAQSLGLLLPSHAIASFVKSKATIILPNPENKHVSCAKLFHGDKTEIAAAEKYQKEHAKAVVSEQNYILHANNCIKFIKERRYIMHSLSQEEYEFPIAFSIMMYKDVEQTERLLRAIYRPQNFYCIHVDRKASDQVQQAMAAIARCFANVFIPEECVSVQWGTHSALAADLVCMKQLLAYKWRYFINLTGQEFPLKTNAELVRILKAFNGSNSMEGTLKRRNMDRFRGLRPAPHGITPTKGSVHITASRGYVNYAFNNHVAIDFLEWVKNVTIPDECFFSSLNHNPQLRVPGAYKGEPETDPQSYPFVTRFKNWGAYPHNFTCAGKRVRSVCIFAVGDLSLLKSRPELFANKFHLDWEPMALDCMEQLYFDKTRDQIRHGVTINDSFYRSLPFVRNHV